MNCLILFFIEPVNFMIHNFKLDKFNFKIVNFHNFLAFPRSNYSFIYFFSKNVKVRKGSVHVPGLTLHLIMVANLLNMEFFFFFHSRIMYKQCIFFSLFLMAVFFINIVFYFYYFFCNDFTFSVVREIILIMD